MTRKAKSTVNKAGNYTKPGMRKRMFSAIKAGGKAAHRDNGLQEKHRCLLKDIKMQVGVTGRNG